MVGERFVAWVRGVAADMNVKVKSAAAAGVVGLGLAAAQLFRQPADVAESRAHELEPVALRLRQPRDESETRFAQPPPFARPATNVGGDAATPLAPAEAARNADSPLDAGAPAPRLPREFPDPASDASGDASDSLGNGDSTERFSSDSTASPVGLGGQPQPGTATARSDPNKDALRHIVIDGDHLPDLARRYLGDPARASEILAANRELISHPDVLPIGAQIVIPGAKQSP